MMSVTQTYIFPSPSHAAHTGRSHISLSTVCLLSAAALNIYLSEARHSATLAAQWTFTAYISLHILGYFSSPTKSVFLRSSINLSLSSAAWGRYPCIIVCPLELFLSSFFFCLSWQINLSPSAVMLFISSSLPSLMRLLAPFSRKHDVSFTRQSHSRLVRQRSYSAGSINAKRHKSVIKCCHINVKKKKKKKKRLRQHEVK